MNAIPNARLALAVADFDCAYAELIARGVGILHPPHDCGSCRAFAVLDPDDNVILLTHCGFEGGDNRDGLA